MDLHRISNIVLVPLSTVIALVAAAFVPGLCQTTDQTAVDTLTYVDTVNYNDGPHVLLRDDTTAIVFYLCDDEMVSEAFALRDTLRFNGLCADTSNRYTVPRTLREHETFMFDGVRRVLTVSDIHGEFDHFVNILRAAGVIDDDQHWIWADGHLVINGDVFDRGTGVTECLWLIHQLRLEASPAGGAVHLLLGNHEMMVLRGDNRYIHERYLDGIVKKTRIKHEDLYGPDMALGRWLRTCPTAITINGILYVHAGMSPRLMGGWNLDRLNRHVQAAINISSSQMAFADTARMLVGSLGPLWYRGYFEDNRRHARATSEDIDQILDQFGVSAVVVGHSGVDSVVSLYEGRVYAIDVDVEALGSLEALLEENGRFFRIAGDGSRRQVVPLQEY